MSKTIDYSQLKLKKYPSNIMRNVRYITYVHMAMMALYMHLKKNTQYGNWCAMQKKKN